MLLGGTSNLVAVEFVRCNPDGDDSLPAFAFSNKRSLTRSCCKRGGIGARCTGICFNPGSDSIAASCAASGLINLWDLAKQRETEPLLAQWQGHQHSANALTWLPDDKDPAKRLVSASTSGALSLWDLGELLDRHGQQSSDDDLGSVLNDTRPLRQSSANSNGMPEMFRDKLTELRPQRHRTTVSVLDLHAQPESGGSKLLVSQADGSACICHVASSASGPFSFSSFNVSHMAVLSGRFHPCFPAMFAAASQDQVIRIVDERKDNRNACACCIRAGTSVGCVRWRPGNSYQIASSGSPQDATVSGACGMGSGLLVWDIRKPFVPLHQFNRQSELMPDFFWADSHHLISCGRDSTLNFHSVLASHQPQSRMCCTAATWSVDGSGTEALAVLSDQVERNVENEQDAENDLYHCMINRGFDSDKSQTNTAGREELREDCLHGLRARPEGLQFLSRFSRPSDGEAGGDQGLLALARLAPFGPPEDGMDAHQLCMREAKRYTAAGLHTRAQTWRLLAEVAYPGMEPGAMLATALSSHCHGPRAPAADSTPPSQGYAPPRGAGARVVQAPTVPGVRPRDVRQQLQVESSRHREQMVADSLDSWQHAWCIETLQHVIAHHEERNDVGMLLALVATFGLGSELDPGVRQRIARWAQGAAEVLTRMRAFVARAALLSSLPLREVEALAQRGTTMYVRCSFCQQPAEPAHGPAARAAGRRLSPVPGVAAVPSKDPARRRPACVGCRRPQAPPCAVCGEEVRGLWSACQVCGHGGHLRHLREWFASGERQCPAGCGHLCAGPGALGD